MDIIPPKNQGEPGPARRVNGRGDGVYPAPDPSSPNYRPMNPSDPPRVVSGGRRNWRGVLSTIGLFASAFLIAILLNTFVIQSYQVDGQSMEPTLQNDDRLIVNKIPRTLARIDGHQYVPHRGDIIIFNQAGLPGFVGQKQLIKRVIGLPGDHVVVTDGRVTVYDKAHPGGYDPDTGAAYRINPGQSCGNVDVNLTANQIFVMGDNRPNSEDSRCFGPITTDQVVAKLILRILPLNKSKSF